MTTNLLSSSPAFTNNTAVGGAFTIVAYTDPIYLVHGAVLRTISFECPTSGTSPVLDSCWVGPAAETGDGYDFDGTQVQVFFGGGNAGVTLTSGGADVVSDDIGLTIDATRPLLVSFHNTAACSYRTKSGEFTTQSWSKSAVSEASTTNKTSYTASGSQNSLKSLNVDMPTGISFHNKGIRASQGFGTSLVFSSTQGLPKNRTNGNILIGMAQVNNSSAHTWPGDWTLLDTRTNNSVTSSVYYRYVDGSETAPTVTWTGSQAGRGMIVQYRGVKADPDGIGNTAQNGGSSTSASCTSPATTQDNSVLLAILGSNNMTFNVTNDASGYTARGFGANISIQDAPIPTSGGTADFALTLSPSQIWQVYIIELVNLAVNLTADLADDLGIDATLTVVPFVNLAADLADDLGISATLTVIPAELDLAADLADDLGIAATLTVIPLELDLTADLADDVGIAAALSIIRPAPVQCIVIAV